jgi:hypothetical protein
MYKTDLRLLDFLNVESVDMKFVAPLTDEMERAEHFIFA